MRVRFVVFAGFFACFTASCASTSYYESANACDPRQEGFFVSISCASKWDDRNRAREAHLANLRTEAQQLRFEQASILDRRERAKRIVRQLKAEAAESRNALNALRRVVNDQNYTLREDEALKREYANLVNQLEAFKLIEFGCRTEEYRRALTNAEVAGAVAGEVIEIGAQEVATNALIQLLPRKYRGVAQFASAIQTLFSVGESISEVDAQIASGVVDEQVACV